MQLQEIPAERRPTAVAAEPTIFVAEEDRYIFCPVRNRAYKVNNKPEEIVQHWWIYRLRDVYGYSFEQIGVQVPVTVGSTEAKKAADIVAYTDSTKRTPRIFIEVKQPKRTDGLEQLKVYMNATGCRLGAWSNGDTHVYFLRIEPAEGVEEPSWRELRNIPARNEQLADVDTPIVRRELEPVTDFLSIIRECENYIKAHEGASPFDEIFKLIFAKLFDERSNLRNDDSPAQFRVGVLEAPGDARQRIDALFERAKARWAGVFDEGETLQLTPESMAFCVSALQKTYLLRSRADILGSAFEVMVNPTMKGDKGQYFTPRHVVKLCIDVLDPCDGETVLDPACGSGGFLVGAMDHVFQKIEAERDDESEILENKKDYASECVFGMDYDRLIAKVAKAYMLIWGDGRSNIAVCDSLNENGWTPDVLAKFTENSRGRRDLRKFNIIATNPPFAGDIAAEETLSKYHLSMKPNRAGIRRRVNKISRDKLFLERCLEMLRPGGRMAIVIPRGLLKNYSDEYVRRHVLCRARVVAVVSLTGDMFKPFTNTKTCVLFLQKRREPLEDVAGLNNEEPTAYCVSERCGKDKSGRMIVDEHGNVISDLSEIAAFIRENTSFEQVN